MKDFDDDDDAMGTSVGGTDSSGRDQQSQASSEESIAKAETQRVNRSKWLVAGILFIAATAVGTATYLFTRNEEKDDFESQVRMTLSFSAVSAGVSTGFSHYHDDSFYSFMTSRLKSLTSPTTNQKVSLVPLKV
jgi:hypothetical protein